MHILRLEARRRIRHLEPVRQREAITRAGASLVDDQLVPAVAVLPCGGDGPAGSSDSKMRSWAGAQRRKRTPPSA